jgi:hypothetical protein
MNSGVLCFNNLGRAEHFLKNPQEHVVNWIDYQLKYGIPDKVINVTVAANKLSPEVIVLKKNELVELLFHNEDGNRKYVFFIKGYDELGEIKLDPTIDSLAFRMLANKPGAGFPIINAIDTELMGMIKVMGAHTADEDVL